MSAVENVADLAAAIVADPAALAAIADAIRPRLVYTTATLAEELGVNERTVRRAISDGELPAHRRLGRWVILAEDVPSWVRSGRASQTVRTRAQRRPRAGNPGADVAAMRRAAGLSA